MKEIGENVGQRFKLAVIKCVCSGTFLVVQSLRLHFPMRGWVQALVQELSPYMLPGQNTKKNQKQDCNKFNKESSNGPHLKNL